MSRTHRFVAPVFVALLLAPLPSAGQASVLLNSLGYGVAGATLGALATANASCEGEFICIPTVTVFSTLGGAALGATLGAKSAKSANRDVAQGRTVGSGHLAAVAIGTVLGGATVGAVASAVLINPDGPGTILGSDEQTFAILTLTGAGLAVLHLRKTWGRLTGAQVDARPAIVGDGQPGIVAHIRF